MNDTERHALQIVYSRMYILWRYCPDVTRQAAYKATLDKMKALMLARGLTRWELREAEKMGRYRMEKVR